MRRRSRDGWAEPDPAGKECSLARAADAVERRLAEGIRPPRHHPRRIRGRGAVALGDARQTKDGLDCYSQGIHNLANTPIEMVEATYPLRFRRYEFLPDTGGAGMPVNVNGSLEGGVGNAANLHLSAALEGEVLPGVITVNTLQGREQTRVGGVFYTDDVITEPFKYEYGCLEVPDRPGLGVVLDEGKIEKYRIN